MSNIRLWFMTLGVGAYVLVISSGVLGNVPLLGFYVVVPIFIALFLSHIWSRNAHWPSHVKDLHIGLIVRSRFFWCLSAFVILAQCVCISFSLLDSTRGSHFYVVYFLSLLGITAQLLLIGVNQKSRLVMILIEIGISSALIVATKVVTYAYYYGGMDAIIHSSLSSVLAQSGHLSPDMGVYYFYPITYIMTAVLLQLVSVSDSLTTLHVIFVLASFFIPFVVFKIGQVFMKSISGQLLMAMLVSHGSLAVYFMSDAMPQGLIYFYAILLSYCFMRPFRHSTISPVVLLLSICLILTHQVMILLVIVGLAALYFVFLRTSVNKAAARSAKNAILVLAFLYLLYSAMVAIGVYYDVIWHRPPPTMGVSILESVQGVHRSSLATLGISAARNLWISAMVFLVVLYIDDRLSSSQKKPRKSGWGLPVLVLLASVVYFPTPLSYTTLLTQVYPLWRIALFVEPLLLAVVAARIVAFPLHRIRSWTVVVVIVALMVFTSVAADRNDSDSPWIGNDEHFPKTYFSETDLSILDLVLSNARNTSLSTDFPAGVYTGRHGLNVGILMLEDNGTVVFPSYMTFLVMLDDFNDRGGTIATYSVQGGPSYAKIVRLMGLEQMIKESSILVDNGADTIVLTHDSFWLTAD